MSEKDVDGVRMSRREFLKLTGMLGATTALSSVGGSLLTGCAPEERTTSMQLGWIKNSQFAGFYAADHKGYYSDENLTVEIAAGGPGIPTQSLVDSREMDIGVPGSSIDLIKSNAEGAHLISFGTLFQRSPAGLLYIIEDPEGNRGTIIDTPEAAKGKRIGLQYLSLAWIVMCEQAGVDPEEDMEIVTVGYDPTPLIDGTVDGYWGFATNQKLVLENMGYEVGFLDSYNWGYKVPGNFICCHQDFLEENKGLLERFMRASTKGWNYTNDNPEEMAQYTIDQFGAEYGLEYGDQYQQIIAQIPFMETPFTAEHGLLAVNMEDWENAVSILVDMGEISSAPDISNIATTDITDAI